MTFSLHNTSAFEWLASQSDGAFDAIITDPPFSERTHRGFARLARADGYFPNNLQFSWLTPEQCQILAEQFSRLARNWIVWMTDHTFSPVIASALESIGRYVFPPLPYIDPARGVRISGDGPCGPACWIVVSRPKSKSAARWGSLPGWYSKAPHWGKSQMVGGKPPGLLRALVRDYTRPGDHICDPFMGAGTTGMAAVELGRIFSGCEIHEGRFAIAKKTIDRSAVSATGTLFDERLVNGAVRRACKKAGLFGGTP